MQVTKLGEGPNSLVSPDESLLPPRLKVFPLYSVLLAYNCTNLDYLSLDSPDAQDAKVSLQIQRLIEDPKGYAVLEIIHYSVII